MDNIIGKFFGSKEERKDPQTDVQANSQQRPAIQATPNFDDLANLAPQSITPRRPAPATSVPSQGARPAAAAPNRPMPAQAGRPLQPARPATAQGYPTIQAPARPATAQGYPTIQAPARRAGGSSALSTRKVLDGKSNVTYGAEKDGASGGEAVVTIDDLLQMVIAEAGSDLHIAVGAPPMLRLQGKLWATDLPVMNDSDVKGMLFNFLTNEQKEELEDTLELDMAYEIHGLARFRCNVFYTRLGLGAVFRVIPNIIKSLQELGMPPVLADLTRRKKGLMLVTGPTGSGKSTTLAAMIDLINKERQEHIITIEHPIEFVHSHNKCLVSQREVGSTTKNFSNALRASLREDPDVILVGEMRDFETIALTVTAAETGHLVFATLHTPSAPQSIERIVDVFPGSQQSQIRTQLADSLNAILAQQLIPALDGSSRVAALEILINIPAVANCIRDNKTYQLNSIMQTSKQQGMQTMDQSLMDLVKQRRIAPVEAYMRAFDKKLFEQYKPINL